MTDIALKPLSHGSSIHSKAYEKGFREALNALLPEIENDPSYKDGREETFDSLDFFNLLFRQTDELKEGLNIPYGFVKCLKSLALEELQIHILFGLYKCYSMDFVADQLFDGRKFRALTLVDNFSRECLAIHAGQSLKGTDVVSVLNELKVFRNIIPQRIQVDNGSEFISKHFDRWAYENKVTLDFSRPGKPTDNPFIESFNGSFRDECLNLNWFLSMEDASEKIAAWKEEYNYYRPHSSLDGMTPNEVVEMYQKSSKSLL